MYQFLSGAIGLGLILSVDSFRAFSTTRCIPATTDLSCECQFLENRRFLQCRSQNFRRQSPIVRMQFFGAQSFGGLFGKRQSDSINVEPSKVQPASEWQSAVDPASGKTYFYNTITLETRWDAPAMPTTPSHAAKGFAKEGNDGQISDATQQDPQFFSLNKANAPAHPAVSCAAFTVAGLNAMPSSRSLADRTPSPMKMCQAGARARTR